METSFTSFILMFQLTFIFLHFEEMRCYFVSLFISVLRYILKQFRVHGSYEMCYIRRVNRLVVSISQ